MPLLEPVVQMVPLLQERQGPMVNQERQGPLVNQERQGTLVVQGVRLRQVVRVVQLVPLVELHQAVRMVQLVVLVEWVVGLLELLVVPEAVLFGVEASVAGLKKFDFEAL